MNLEGYIWKEQLIFLPQCQIKDEEDAYLLFHKQANRHFDFLFSNVRLQSNLIRYHVDQTI